MTVMESILSFFPQFKYIDFFPKSAIIYITMVMKKKIGNEKLIEMLVENGTDVNVRNSKAETILHLACAKGDSNCQR